MSNHQYNCRIHVERGADLTRSTIELAARLGGLSSSVQIEHCDRSSADGRLTFRAAEPPHQMLRHLQKAATSAGVYVSVLSWHEVPAAELLEAA